MNASTLAFPENVVGGDSPIYGTTFEQGNDVEAKEAGLIAKYLLRGGGSWGDFPADRAVRAENERRKRDDPEGYAKWQKEIREKYGGVVEDVKAAQKERDIVDWNIRGRPVKQIDLTPSPETQHDRVVREEMAKHGYVPSGRDPKTGKIEFTQAGEPPWFLSILGNGYEMVGSVMHNLPRNKGALGVGQKLETAVGSLLIGDVRDGDPVLAKIHKSLAGTGEAETGDSRILGLMRKSPALRDISYALWLGHMQALGAFQENLHEGTELLNHYLAKKDDGSLSDDDWADVMVSVLATATPEAKAYSARGLIDSGIKEAIITSLQRRGLKMPQELKEPLEFLGLADDLFLDRAYVKASRIPNVALEQFTSLIEQATYTRLTAELSRSE